MGNSITNKKGVSLTKKELASFQFVAEDLRRIFGWGTTKYQLQKMFLSGNQLESSTFRK